VQIGDYTVRPALATGLQLTTAATRPIDVTRGGSFNNISFGVRGRAAGVTPSATAMAAAESTTAASGSDLESLSV
jgi:hypothetical protein